MRLLATIVLLLVMGPTYVQAHAESDWISLGSLEKYKVRSEDQRTRDSDEGFRDRGRLLGSFRRTAARLQEYDGLNSTGDLGRDGLDWAREPISKTKTEEDIKGAGPRFPRRWAKKVSIPNTSSEYLIFFTMDGCQPCKSMYPIIEALEAEGYEIHVAHNKYNTTLVNQYNVSSYPTIMIFEGGEMIQRFGSTTRSEILKYLKKPQPDLPLPLPPTPNPNPDRPNYDFVSGPSYRLW